MGLPRQLLRISMLWFCYYSLFTILREDSPSNFINADQISAYPTCSRPTNAELGTTYTGFEGFDPSFLSLKGSDCVGSPDDQDSSDAEISVDDLGAKGDGTDDTEAFEKAWEEACSSDQNAVLVVPENKNYLLKQISFSGPCKSDLQVKILGTIEASSDRSDWNGLNQRVWIEFKNIDNLTVEGGGIIDGNGKTWWDNSCKRNKDNPCKGAPTALTFASCNNLTVNDMRIKDSQQMHLSFENCEDVRASQLLITAPEDSPNTDGIHITSTESVLITDSVIRTGDDCISIESGSKNIKAMNITCGPGHGISIGSLGDGNSESHVSDVLVDGANLYNTTNGARIKTWQGGSGNAKNIRFQNIFMHNVKFPIIIDQNYCDSEDACPKQDSAVKISNVAYENIIGTSAFRVAVKFDCSKSSPCKGIVLENINLVRKGGKKTTMVCNNVQGTTEGDVYPHSCL